MFFTFTEIFFGSHQAYIYISWIAHVLFFSLSHPRFPPCITFKGAYPRFSSKTGDMCESEERCTIKMCLYSTPVQILYLCTRSRWWWRLGESESLVVMNFSQVFFLPLSLHSFIYCHWRYLNIYTLGVFFRLHAWYTFLFPATTFCVPYCINLLCLLILSFFSIPFSLVIAMMMIMMTMPVRLDTIYNVHNM